MYGAPQFRVLHWVKAPRGMGTIWCDVPEPLPPLQGPYSSALEKLFGVKPAVKSAGTLQSCKLLQNIPAQIILHTPAMTNYVFTADMLQLS